VRSTKKGEFAYFIKFPHKYPINNVVCHSPYPDFLASPAALPFEHGPEAKPWQIKYAYVFKWLTSRNIHRDIESRGGEWVWFGIGWVEG